MEDKMVDAILRLIQNDPHGWSSRPCQTCQTITGLVGKSFGCYFYQAANKEGKG